MSRLSGVSLVLAATAVWGVTFPVVKGALADTGPLTFLALRFGLAALLLLPTLPRAGRWRGGLGWSVACGVALYLGYLFQTWGLVTATPARSAFITALSAVLVPLLEPPCGLAPFSWRSLSGAAVALAGLAVLLRPRGEPMVVGDLLTLGCAAAFAAHTLLLNRAVRGQSPQAVNAAQMTVVAALAVPCAGTERLAFVASPRLVGAVLITALLATVGAFWAMAAAQRALTAAQTGVILAFEPVAAAVASLLLGQDHLTTGLLVGGALVVAGVVLATSSAPAEVSAPVPHA